MENPREIAVRVLNARRGGEYSESLLEAELGKAEGISGPDRRLAQELVYGCVRWQATLDWLVARKTGGRTQKVFLQNLLRLGLYQIFWMDRIPVHAAVNETVASARRNGFGPQSGFVNALLRGYLREEQPTRQLLENLKREQPEIGYSHPQWLVERWKARWGSDKTAQLLDWNNRVPGTFARVNTLKTTAEQLLERWRAEAVEYDFCQRDWLEPNSVFELKGHPPLHRLGSFQEGLFYVQDPSTLLSVREVGAQPGETVLDLCAAPGGKLTALAAAMRNEGRVLGHDPVPARLRLVRENCERLGVTCATLLDAEGLSGVAPGSVDRVLIDAPCSNTGVLRRRIDARWRLKPEEIERLVSTQRELLSRAAGLVKPGGVLVYSTCSLEPEENAETVKFFLSTNPWFRLERERELTGFGDGVDGAFVGQMLKS